MAAALCRGVLRWIHRLAPKRAVWVCIQAARVRDTPSGDARPAGGFLWPALSARQAITHRVATGGYSAESRPRPTHQDVIGQTSAIGSWSVGASRAQGVQGG
jgi:hypothetical protein